MCDHYSVDCVCQVEDHYLYEKKQRKPGPKKKNAKEALITAASVTEDRDKLVPMIDGHVTTFVSPDQAVKAEVLHELTTKTIKSASMRSEDIVLEGMMLEDGDVKESDPSSGGGAIDGDVPCDYKDLTVATSTGDDLAMVPVTGGQDTLFDEAKEMAVEILTEDLHAKAVSSDHKQLHDTDTEEGHRRSRSSKAWQGVSEEQVLEAIKEAVTEALKASGDAKEGVKSKDNEVDEQYISCKADHSEISDEIGNDEKIEQVVKLEDTENQTLSTEFVASQQLLATTLDSIQPSTSTDPSACTLCTQHAKQQSKFVMTQDPTISLGAASILFSQADDEVSETVITPFEKAFDAVMEPVCRPAAEVAHVIVTGLAEDGALLADMINEGIENAVEKTVDGVVVAADFVIFLLDSMCDFMDWFAVASVEGARDLDRAARIMAAEAVGIASELFTYELATGSVDDFAEEFATSFDDESDTLPEVTEKDSETQTFTDSTKLPSWFDDDLLDESWSLPSSNNWSEIPTASHDSQLIAENHDKQTPLRWLAGVAKSIFGSTTQSANRDTLSEWPHYSGLAEWPLSGNPGQQ